MRRLLGVVAGSLISFSAFAGNVPVYDTKIQLVYLNGGADTANPGTTCIKVASPISSACPSGMVAIQNNNSELIAAAMQAKATGALVDFYYNDAGGPFHCPQYAFTPCSVLVIGIK